VLIAGGYTGTTTTATAELYDPGTGTWTAVATMSTPRQWQSATLLANGTALVVGGLNDTASPLLGTGIAEVYDPGSNAWTPTGAMESARSLFVLNALPDGRVMIDGGQPNAYGLPEFYR
jgi:hypothetical protein